VTSRLDNIEERKRESLNSYDAAAYAGQGQRGNSSYGKGYYGLDTELAQYWEYEDFGNTPVPTGEQDGVFSTGNETTMRNNRTLNNQVPPGTRANNFYDNFRR